MGVKQNSSRRKKAPTPPARVGRFLVTLAERWLPLSIGGVLLVAGHNITAEGAGHPDIVREVGGLLATELGYAFLIAAILFVVFEEWSARQHCKTAIGLLYGVRPEGVVFDKIEEYVLKQKFYRSKVVVTYAFEKKSGEALRVRISIRYQVTNVCAKDAAAAFPLRGRVDLKPLHMGTTEWDNELGLEFVSVDGERVAPDKIRRKPDSETCSEAWEARQQPSIAYGETIEIEASQYVVKHDHDSAVWTSTIPSDGVELHVTWEEPLRLKFVFSPIHPELEKLKPKVNTRRRTLSLKKPLLKGHGVHIQWAPDPEEAAT